MQQTRVAPVFWGTAGLLLTSPKRRAMNSFVRLRNDPSPVQHRTGGIGHWLALLLLLFPFAVFVASDATAYSITDFVTCENAKMEAPHDWHVPQAVFRSGDDRFFAWVELKDVLGKRSVEMKLYRPDGTYYGEETQAINETNGIASWWRMAAWWRIKGDGPAQTPGLWKLDLVVDGTLQRSIHFNINSGNPVLGVPVQPSASNSVVAAPTISTPRQDAGVWIIEASSDLVRWKAIQTNALPICLLRGSTTGKGCLRLGLDRYDVSSCIIEASPDLLKWIPIQTNALARPSQLDESDAPLVTARFYRVVIH
jgi:hypothetical protein